MLSKKGSLNASALIYPDKTGIENRKLILIQIDGLSHKQLCQAIENDEMPFVKNMILKKRYKISSFYSGLPSSTPSVQAELMYGVRCVVPSFGFYDRNKKEFVSMLYPKIVNEITKELERNNEGLLRGGCAYADDFIGGAEKSLFCVGRSGFYWKWIKKHPLGILLVAVIHIGIFAKIVLLLIAELLLSIVSLINGIINNENLIMEISFIPARVGICVLLRELIVAGVGRDIQNGYSIIHCNFNGYDEQAHRRGPSSRFAHWTLKGIDSAVRRISDNAEKFGCKQYNIWIYSDHGQEKTIPYHIENKRSIHDAVSDVFKCKIIKGYDQPLDTAIVIRRFTFRLIENIKKKYQIKVKMGRSVFVSAMGPVGHIYISEKITMSQKWNYASKLVKNANIPTVLFLSDSNRVVGYTCKGACYLPENINEVIGTGHPFVKEISEDLITLVAHHYSGEFVILGWRTDKLPLSFSMENGAHAGPGYEETHGFVLSDSDHSVFAQNYLRPQHLREAVLNYLE